MKTEAKYIVMVDGKDMMHAQGKFQLRLVLNNLKHDYPNKKISYRLLNSLH